MKVDPLLYKKLLPVSGSFSIVGTLFVLVAYLRNKKIRTSFMIPVVSLSSDRARQIRNSSRRVTPAGVPRGGGSR